MKVIFLEDIAGTADAGEVKNVKNGFARNYLLPKGLAAPATPDQLQRIHAIEKNAHANRLKFSDEWSEVAKLIEGTTVPVEVRVGPTGRLFGSVTGRQIAEKLTEATGREIDHRQVLLGTAIHDPGNFPVSIHLYRDVVADVTVSVIPEGLTEEETAAMAALSEEAEAFFAESEAAKAAEGAAGSESAEGEGEADATSDQGPSDASASDVSEDEAASEEAK